MIGVNEIADLVIDFGFNHGFWGSYYGKIRVFVGNHYQLHGHSNGTNYL